MSCGRQSLEKAHLRKEQRPGVNGEDRSFFGAVVFLEIGKGSDEAEGLALVLEDLVVVAARHDEDVVFLELFVGLTVGEVGAEGAARGGYDGLAGADEFTVEGFVF